AAGLEPGECGSGAAIPAGGTPSLGAACQRSELPAAAGAVRDPAAAGRAAAGRLARLKAGQSGAGTAVRPARRAGGARLLRARLLRRYRAGQLPLAAAGLPGAD